MRTRGRLLAAPLLAAVAVLGAGGASALGAPHGAASFTVPRGSRAAAGLDGRLAAVARGGPGAVGLAQASGLDVDGAKVRIVVDATGVAPAKASIAASGGTVQATYRNLVEALVPPAALARLPASAGVANVRAPAMHTALAVDEAVASTRADSWQAGGLTGNGVKVAVIDGGFQGYAAAVPGAALVNTDCANPQGSPHGTAVAQIVRAMAPNAQLTLICMDSEVGLGNAEQYVVANGIKIVNHSIGWFGVGRGDGSGGPGTIDGIVRDARAHGVLWVNAAGNEAAGDGWAGFPTDVDGDDVLEWFGGNPFNDVTLANGSTDCGVLRWDAWPVTSQDYDLYLVDAGGNVVASSAADQAGGPSEPVEETCFTNATGTTTTFSWVIVRYSATVTPRFDFFSLAQDAGVGTLLYSTAASTIGDPASSPAALAVGAHCWQPPGFGLTAGAEPYSSRGPTVDGRHKPDLIAPDSVSGTGYGDFTGCGTSGFTGTSAAAPHVAGAAALLLQRTPSLTVDQLQGQLERSAADIGSSEGLAPGKTDVIGEGALSLGLFATSTQPPLVLARSTVFYDGLGFTTGSENLFVANADGTALTRLTHTDNTHLQRSPDARGNTIVFGEPGALSTRSLLGGSTTTLAAGSHLWVRLDAAGTKMTFARDGFP